MNNLIISETGTLVRAELDTQITTAKAYPRKHSSFIEEATSLATISQETAESCFYALARKDKDGKRSDIKGPSIRLAEIAASCWGNIHSGARIIENDGKFITAEGVAWDLEKNVKISMQVKRKITTKEGRTYSEDMQTVTGNAACAIALRNAIFKVVPKSLVDVIYQASIKHAVGDQKTLSVRINNALSKFSSLGIPQEKIFTYFNKKSASEFDQEDLAEMIGAFTAIKEGSLSIDKAFSTIPEDDGLSPQERIKNITDKLRNEGDKND